MRTSRRSFLRLASIAGSALVIELHWRTTHGAEAPEVTSFQPSARLRLDVNGAITLTLGRSEMGQGVRTSLPMILAEELEIDPDRLTLVQAEPGPEFQDMKTSGTGSVLLGFAPLARLGAVARETLIDAAAALRAVDRTKLRAAAGRVLCDDPAFALDYAELVATASTLPLATVPAPKRPPAFRVLGKPRLRVDGPALVDGRARFGIDVVVPGMRFATRRSLSRARRFARYVRRHGGPEGARRHARVPDRLGRRRGRDRHACGVRRTSRAAHRVERR
jgi:isoquinoline 1-oxidoreductase beta subunit